MSYNRENVIDLTIKRAVRQMDDWRIQNFVWYFERYKPDFGLQAELANECMAEAERRGITEGVLSIGN